jgi:hypothetical protein
MIVQDNFNPYPKDLLPTKFIYPVKYLEISENPKLVNHNKDYHFRWWFEDAVNEGSKLSYRLRNDKIEGLNLVPFAQNGDWLANFDGDDTSGNPRVVVVDLGDLPFHMICEDFADWLTKAEQDYWSLS